MLATRKLRRPEERKKQISNSVLFVEFVLERHKIFEARRKNLEQPWTNDPILASKKFTNVFRLADPGSQFLINELLEHDLDPRDIMARCFFYRYTNLPSTWNFMFEGLGDYPTATNFLKDPIEIAEVIHEARDRGEKVFSGAYMILPAPNTPGDKVEQAVALTTRWLRNHWKDFEKAKTQQARFDILRREHGVGNFMAMQILTDYGYSSQCGEDRENEFVMPGPGSTKGAKLYAPLLKGEEAIHDATVFFETMKDAPRLPNGRGLSLMDVQNCFCEFMKYMRYRSQMGKHDMSKLYKPRHPGRQLPITIPDHLT